MFTPEQEYYLRFILLLLEGGTELLRGFAEKALASLGQTLQQFLNTNETAIRNDKFLKKDQLDILFPGTPQGSDIENFDITLLAHLIVNYLPGHLSSTETNIVKSIREMRNSKTHSPEASMFRSVFVKEHYRLTKAIQKGYAGLGTGIQDNLNKIIKKATDDPLDKATVEKIRQLDKCNAFFPVIEKSLEDIKKGQNDIKDGQKQLMDQQQTGFATTLSTLDELKSSLAQIQAQMTSQKDIKEKVVHTVSYIVHILGADQESVNRAEDALLKELEGVLANSDSEGPTEDELKDSVRKFLQEVKHINVTVVKVEKHSIVLEFTSSTVDSILALIDYFESPGCRKCLNEIARTLEVVTGKKYKIEASMDIQSLEKIVTHLCVAFDINIPDVQVRCSNPTCMGKLKGGECITCGGPAKLYLRPEGESKCVSEGGTVQHGEMAVFGDEVVEKDIVTSAGPILKMAASGRTASDLKDSLVQGSDEDFTIYCAPCKSVGHFLEAEGFCVDCQENQCRNCLDVHKKIGAIKHHNILDEPQKEVETRRDVRSVVYKNDINVKTKSDKRVCDITGCAVISAHKLLLTDFNNNKLKVVNIDTQSVVEEMTVGSQPWDVTVLPQNQAAVTLWKKILIVGTAGKLKTIRRIQVRRYCWGITYHQDHLYAVCGCPNSLLVLDMRGNVQREIPLQRAQDQTFSSPQYIAVSKNGERLYISDIGANLVASLTLQGEITAVYKHQKLVTPLGLLVLGDESLLVCCLEPGTIHHVQADMKQGRTLTGDVPKAQSICYHPGNQLIYVGSVDCDQIKVFSLQ